MTTVNNVQLDYKDNLLETMVNLHEFYSLNLWRILSGGLGWSSHTVKRPVITAFPNLSVVVRTVNI